jgi:hypothetical protein
MVAMAMAWMVVMIVAAVAEVTIIVAMAMVTMESNKKNKSNKKKFAPKAEDSTPRRGDASTAKREPLIRPRRAPPSVGRFR